MDQTLKQRLIGALVLLSAAVIFLPLILDGREEQEVYTDIQIPPEPLVTMDVTEPKIDVDHFENVKKKVEAEREAVKSFKTKPASQTDSLSTTQSESRVVEAASHQESPVEPQPAFEKPKVAVKKVVTAIQKESKQAQTGVDRLAEAYAVQVAAFSSKENAEKLYKKLRAKEYAAYIQKGKSGDKTLFRVFVGPELRKNRAAMIADALHKEFKLKGMVVRYAP